MEFRCRLGTPSGEIVEGLYEAEGEAQLRRRLEHEGLLVLSVRRRTAVGAGGIAAPPAAGARAARVHPFQSGAGDAAQGRSAAGRVARHSAAARRQPGVPFDARRCPRARAGRRRAVGCIRGAVGLPLPGVYIASLDRRREAAAASSRSFGATSTTPGMLAAVRRKTLSALIYPAVLLALSLIVVAIIVLQVVPAFADFYDGFGAELPLATRTPSSPLPTSLRATLPAMLALLAAGRRWYGLLGLAAASRGCCCRSIAWLLRLPGAGGRGRQVRDVAAWPGRWRRCCAAGSRSSMRLTWPAAPSATATSRTSLKSLRERCARAARWPSAMDEQANLPARGDPDGRGGRIDRRAARNAGQRCRLLRRGDRDDAGTVHDAHRAASC